MIVFKNNLYKIIFIIIITISNLIHAQNNEPKKSRELDKIDIKKIEDEFWSAKDTDFKVIQNRAFPKENRFFLSLSTGSLFNDPFTSSVISKIGLGYYFSERWGIEISQDSFSTTDNKATSYFKSKNVYPNYNILTNYQSISLMIVPFYAKMSLIDRMIMYFDMQINIGIGQKQYGSFIKDEAPMSFTTMGYHLDVTQNLFFSKYISLRFDFKNQWSTQKTHFSDTGSGVIKKQQERELVVNDSILLIGLSFFY